LKSIAFPHALVYVTFRREKKVIRWI
jgi:hypothetical protein